jgi:hypothetical protein
MTKNKTDLKTRCGNAERKPLACCLCDKKYLSRFNLIRHLITKHEHSTGDAIDVANQISRETRGY